MLALLEAHYLPSRALPLVKSEHLNIHMMNVKDQCTGEVGVCWPAHEEIT